MGSRMSNWIDIQMQANFPRHLNHKPNGENISMDRTSKVIRDSLIKSEWNIDNKIIMSRKENEQKIIHP